MKKIIDILLQPWKIPILIIIRIPYFNFIRYTTDYQCSINFALWFRHKILNLGDNNKAYWPVNPTSKIVNPKNIFAGIDTCPGLMGGCYIQGIGKIYIGDYTQIASNVIIISANHDLYDSRKHIPNEVRIGKYCWIGAGAKIMPGVVLGDFTIIGAGAIVTKSFLNGHCVIAGNPARLIKELDVNLCLPFKNKIEYNGYIRSDKFNKYRTKFLNV
jgi:acetyltransferase-like isoleucine patch superfamily enzyme